MDICSDQKRFLSLAGLIAGVIVAAAAVGSSCYGIYEVSKLSFTIHRQCDETNCTVNVIDGVCFAIFVELSNTTEPIKVKCDKKRKGTYEIILPCDIDYEGKPKLNCDKSNGGLVAALFFLVLGLILFFTIFVFLLCSAGSFIENLYKDRFGYPQNSTQNDTQTSTQNSTQNQNSHWGRKTSNSFAINLRRPKDDIECGEVCDNKCDDECDNECNNECNNDSNLPCPPTHDNNLELRDTNHIDYNTHHDTSHHDTSYSTYHDTSYHDTSYSAHHDTSYHDTSYSTHCGGFDD